MQKRVFWIAGLLALLPLLVVVLLQPGGGLQPSRVSAAHLDSTFSSPYNISNSSYAGTQHPRLVIDPSAYLHVTWMEGVPDTDNGPAYVKGQGTTWPAWEWAGPHNNNGYTNPAIALDSTGTVHLVWAGANGGEAPYDIFYAYKAAGGAWSTPANLSNEGYNTVYPSIAVDSQDNVWAAWQASLSDTEAEVYTRYKPAGGSWGGVMRVSNLSGQDLNVRIAVDNSNVPHIVWRNNTAGGNWEIYYSKYVGSSWTTPLNVSGTSTASHFPDIAADNSGNLFVVWEDEIDGTDHFQILFRRWDGTQWQSYRRVSSSSKALYPFISADGCNLYVVWEDFRDNPSVPETYFSHSVDCGTTWLGDENVSRNGTSSYFPDVVAQSGGYAHIVWQDMAPGQLDIYYSKATVTGAPTPAPTTIIPTSAPTSTPTPTPTPDPRPRGYVDIAASDPAYDHNYTRLLTVTLELSATSDVGGKITDMSVCNLGECLVTPVWIPFAGSMVHWPLLADVYDCEYKWVNAQFRDDFGRVSIVYADYIDYDNYLTATMAVGGSFAYGGGRMAVVSTVDVDGQTQDCSGLDRMSFSTDGLTYTVPISFTPAAYIFLPPSGGPTYTIYARYWDRANNTRLFGDSIFVDTIPPTGTAPLLNNGVSSTTHLLIPISGLQGYDQSGIANVWFSNRPDGPWMAMPYVDPPHDYTWNLAYGGPPIQYPDLHHVYVKYEDKTGYGLYPGNFSQVYSGTISVSGISSTYLPLAPRLESGLALVPGPSANNEVDLILVTQPQQAGPGQDVLIWLAARRQQHAALEGDLRMVLPEGLRVVRAWSAYGQLLQVSDRVVVSHERTWDWQVPWILVQAHVESGAGAILQVQGDMTWAQGTAAAPLLRIENH